MFYKDAAGSDLKIASNSAGLFSRYGDQKYFSLSGVDILEDALYYTNDPSIASPNVKYK